jgi:hypothetical protein
VCPETGFALFDNYSVFHRVILFQTGLFENTVQRAWRNVNVWLAGHRHGSAFRLMFELSVAAFRPSQIPTIVFQQPNEVSDFHARIIKASSVKGKPHNI